MVKYGKMKNMRSMGIRVASNEVFYAIIEGTVLNPSLIFHSKLAIPKSFKDGQALSWVRESIMNVLKEYQISSVFIRTIEPKARIGKKAITNRCKIEAVLLEAANTSGSRNSEGALVTITSLLAAKSVKSAKEYLELEEFREVEGWEDLNDNYKEASLAGIAALAL
jgi:hypothetical protein